MQAIQGANIKSGSSNDLDAITICKEALRNLGLDVLIAQAAFTATGQLTVRVHGVFWSPEAFVAKAIGIQHPLAPELVLSEILLNAVRRNCNSSHADLAEMRTEEMDSSFPDMEVCNELIAGVEQVGDVCGDVCKTHMLPMKYKPALCSTEELAKQSARIPPIGPWRSWSGWLQLGGLVPAASEFMGLKRLINIITVNINKYHELSRFLDDLPSL